MNRGAHKALWLCSAFVGLPLWEHVRQKRKQNNADHRQEDDEKTARHKRIHDLLFFIKIIRFALFVDSFVHDPPPLLK